MLNSQAYRPATSTESIGLKIGQIFPSLNLKNSKNDTVQLSSLITQKTVIMVQPGASHKGQWDGLSDALEAWKVFLDPSQTEKCVAGCTGHLKGYIDQYFAYKAAGYNVIIIMSDKTAEQLSSLEEEKASPFSLYSLTPESFAELKRLEQPVFKFAEHDYVYRNTWAVTLDMKITHSTDSTKHVAEISAKEAEKFLGELKADTTKLNLND